MRRFRCVPLREELVLLTQDYKKAIVLGQMIYWAERVRDVAQYIEEEKHRTDQEEEGLCGWFYKKAEELAEETLMGIKPKSMRMHLKALVERGWLDERHNPHDRMDHTLQYRVNFFKIKQDLHELACPFTWSLFSSLHTVQNENAERHKRTFAKDKKEAPHRQKENLQSPKNVDTQRVQALPLEITETEIKKTEITKQQQPHDVVVVLNLVQELFGKELSLSNVHTLLSLARKADVKIEDVIRNTYRYHSEVQPCTSLMGALRYAIQNGGWDVGMPSKPTVCPKPLPKAVQRQLDRKSREKEECITYDPLVIARKKEEIAIKIAELYDETLL